MNLINNKTLLISGFVLLAMLSSCERDYLEKDPTESASELLVTSNLENLTVALNGMHRNMYYRQNSNQGQNGNTGIMIYMDVMGEDLVFPSTGNNWFVSALRWLDSSNAVSGGLFYPYNFYYRQIRIANIILKAAPDVSGEQTDKDRVMGEAYAFRAYSYFMLTQIYGKRYVASTDNTQPAVPLRLDDSFTPVPRSSVEELYAQINSDLEQAHALLTGKARANKSHFNAAVVRGLMARVALVQGRYADAATFAGEAKQGFSLMTHTQYKSGFNNYSNPEWIWGYKPIVATSDYFGNFMAFMSRNYNSTQIRQAPKVVSSLLYAQFPATDVRIQVIDPTGAHAALGLPSTFNRFPYTSQKFISVNAEGAADNNTSLGDIPFMRSAEMYLIEAEALARDNREAESKAVFNELTLNRNPSYSGAATTGQHYIDEILTSRRLELWGEGFRFLDLKRLNLPLDRTGANHVSAVINNLNFVPAGDKRWTWLIPQSEINASQGLVEQNEL
nr:RagB/SusD family nutrient uptake outer membrane protein [uncultured Chryseobacterium sp.]